MEASAARLRSVFINDEEHRLRTPWRLLVGTMVLFTVVGIVGAAGTLIAAEAGLDPDLQTTPVGNALAGLAVLVVGTLTIAIIARVVDRRSITDYGLQLESQWLRECAIGAGLGIVLQTGIFVIALAGGWITVTGYFVASGSAIVGIGALLLLYVAVGIVEEVFARGWLMTNLGEGLRQFGQSIAVGGAVGVSAVLFGLLHLGNPGANWFSTAVIAGAGVLFALGYVITGRLGFPIGLHITWNFTQGAVFGFPVSGIPPRATVIETERVGGETFVGGGFGPEAGVLGLVAILLGIASCYWLLATDQMVQPGLFEPPENE